MTTWKQQVVEFEFAYDGINLGRLVDQHRRAGLSWREITRIVNESLSPEVRVSHNALHRWYAATDGRTRDHTPTR